LSNAAKFSPPDSGIRVTIAARDDSVTRLSVADNGTGIAPEAFAMAIRPFRQIDGRLARKHGGTGLGLSVVSGLIDRHGGQLTLDCAPQQGTCVSLDFPAARAQSERRQIAAVAD